VSTPIPESPVPLAVATRGGAVESVHHGSVAVVDVDGNLVAAAGDPHFLTFTRSALKPLQAMPFLAAGGPEQLGFGAPELALMCASHCGDARHVAVVESMLARIGLSDRDLQCGTHPPYFYRDRGESPPAGAHFRPVHNNCSGKHTGMLAWCTLCGEPTASYLDYDHPLQQAIRAAVAHFTGVAEERLVYGVDGCSAPNYAVPLSGLARAFALLARDRADPVYGEAPRLAAAAMNADPALVSGEGTADLALMRAGRGDWVVKVGAEGVRGIGIRSRGLGLAIKVADGTPRALHPATVEVLDQLGVLDADQRHALRHLRFAEIRNVRGTVVGGVAPEVVVRRR
jgi:L-asparaginase II